MQLFVEATSVGMLIAILGYLFNYIAIHIEFLDKLYNGSIVIKFFITGFVTHLLFEFLGFNRWYCKNGFACK